jgi:hypothetical protein
MTENFILYLDAWKVTQVLPRFPSLSEAKKGKCPCEQHALQHAVPDAISAASDINIQFRCMRPVPDSDLRLLYLESGVRIGLE